MQTFVGMTLRRGPSVNINAGCYWSGFIAGWYYSVRSQSSPTQGGPKSLCGLLATKRKPAAW